MDAIVEILLCEGGDVELGARTSKHILLLAIDPLSLLSVSLSLSHTHTHCALHHIIHIIYMLGFDWCHTCVQPRSFK